MKQKLTIKNLKSILPKITGINAAILYGSFGRGKGNPNSDIDIQLWINPQFDLNSLSKKLKNELDDILHIQQVSLRNKLVVYLKNNPKIEFTFCSNLEEVNRNYIGSEITDITDTILFVNHNNEKILLTHLKTISKTKSDYNSEEYLNNLIDKFLYEFENCSNMHARSDGYRFYFFYNIALHIVTQLLQLSEGQNSFNFLPRYLLAETLKVKEEQNKIYDLNGTLFLPDANAKKRKLLDAFYESLKKIVPEQKVKEIEKICEFWYERDYFWNFRDIAKNNSLISNGKIFRTATLTFFQNDDRYIELLKNKNITTIIDLRAEREIKENPYNPDKLNEINYLKAPFDPWNQPKWYKEKYNYGTNEEIAYRFFALGCKEQIKNVIEAILKSKGAVAIHCFAGKDRTGIFISMLHLLSNAPLNSIEADYLASEVDVKLHRLQLVLDIIKEHGGIVKYFQSCNLSNEQILKLKNQLTHG